jgi:hypothetical protein
MRALALAALFLAGPAFAGEAKPAAKPPAKVTVTAEVGCLHCDYGIGDGCAACLKLNKDTPLVLEGKGLEPLFKVRFDKKVAVVEGTLAKKGKKLTLTVTKARIVEGKDRAKALAAGQTRIVGLACCGSCDLGLCDTCTAAFTNGTSPIILDGKLAARHLEAKDKARPMTAVGKLFLDKRGLVRLEAVKVELPKEKK